MAGYPVGWDEGEISGGRTCHAQGLRVCAVKMSAPLTVVCRDNTIPTEIPAGPGPVREAGEARDADPFTEAQSGSRRQLPLESREAAAAETWRARQQAGHLGLRAGPANPEIAPHERGPLSFDKDTEWIAGRRSVFSRNGAGLTRCHLQTQHGSSCNLQPRLVLKSETSPGSVAPSNS